MIDDDLVNLKKYPEQMYMDIYGNGHKTWDQQNSRTSYDAIFRAKYIRADIVLEEIEKARKEAYDLAIDIYKDKEE